MAERRARAVLLLAALLPAAFACAKVTFTANQALTFGRFAAGTAVGTITVSPSGVRSRSGGVMLLTSTATAATFTYNDNSPSRANSACIIGLPSDNTIILSAGTSQMQLKTFTSTPSSGTCVLSNGTLQFSVGATMTVNANQPKGSYTGSIPITIQYQ
jgi:hypothetical protein